MCGITGFFSPGKMFSKEDLVRMTDLVAHRGPDAEGFYMDDIAGLGHRRLSIIDISEKANQPMYSRNGRYAMVYNGEVYNYREIGNELKTIFSYENPIEFKSASDTEVILEAFSHFGVSVINKLNGMYAFAIWDILKKKLYIFRDRLGIKPLYYFWDGENFAFASELKSLVTLSQIPKKINRNIIRDFLHLGYIPAPFSIYESVKKLEAGCYMIVSEGDLEFHRYWSLKSRIANEVIDDKKQAMIKLSDLLMSSVQNQLKNSDVPFGVFLSGGIDSSLITAYAVQTAGVKVNTFSIGFEENRINESEYAKAVAQYLDTNHHEFIVSHKDAILLLDNIFYLYDEPFADSSALPTMLVSKLAKQHVTVTLSGEGGDELFFGYGFYKWARRLHNPLLRAFRKPISSVLASLHDRYRRAGSLFEYTSVTRIKSHIFSQEQYLFSDRELENLLSSGYNFPSIINESLDPVYTSSDIHTIRKRNLNEMEAQALYDLQYYLPDDLLTKVDRASMQYSVETRVPYLDHRVVEFSLNLSSGLKYRDGINKYILKEILYQYIPQKYFDRPKQGFAIPLKSWLGNELRYLIEDFLSKEIIEKYDVVKYEYVENIKRDFFAGESYLYNRLWVLIVLHKWLDMAYKRNLVTLQ